jgi:chorismate-pyruvate lyase
MDEFYEQGRLPPPAITQVDEAEIPDCFRRLLVHSCDMTPTLADSNQCRIELRVLQFWHRADSYSRKIVLTARDKPVLFGAIKVYLDRFPAEARSLVLGNAIPFGTILQTCGIVHSSSPLAFFRINADPEINRALDLTGAPVLYGRRNISSDATGQVLAQVFEVLAPPARLF